MDYQTETASVNYKCEQDDCSNLEAEFSSTVDDILYSSQAMTMDVDVSLEWLSAFVEECLSTKGSTHPLPPPSQLSTQLNNPPTKPSSLSQLVPTSSNSQFTHFPAVPGKARSKRRRRTPSNKMSVLPLISRRLRQLNLLQNKHSLQLTSSTDPLLLQQTYWLADSELLLPPEARGGEREKTVDMGQIKTTVEKSVKKQQQGAGSGRRCSHCQAQRTPQWRSGPLGPKTLCNACGVRYKKSGRLLPEYRPANSPTFVSLLHSNSHKRVMEMRMMNASSSTSTPTPTCPSSS
ncbi:GATA transcription factor 12-like [Cucumis melo var. makuwa]|uniref:GATA transcription factor 12-like n=2 Tax=Cucumis melo TaxID=3656 RepID=A0A1S3CNM0_CUCME|nr:GATA transcription factor 12-like [Cucumis melo]KAA0051278.1 GATA transcription factor 12-like [Cucumis melo var. makuwa]TYK29983.1 GATA transcription factor 12-like [Cucumis melo var. makuwa]